MCRDGLSFFYALWTLSFILLVVGCILVLFISGFSNFFFLACGSERELISGIGNGTGLPLFFEHLCQTLYLYDAGAQDQFDVGADVSFSSFFESFFGRGCGNMNRKGTGCWLVVLYDKEIIPNKHAIRIKIIKDLCCLFEHKLHAPGDLVLRIFRSSVCPISRFPCPLHLHFHEINTFREPWQIQQAQQARPPHSQ